MIFQPFSVMPSLGISREISSFSFFLNCTNMSGPGSIVEPEYSDLIAYTESKCSWHCQVYLSMITFI